MPLRTSRYVALALLLSLTTLSAQPGQPAKALVAITLDESVSKAPVSGRLLVLMTSNPKPLDVITPGFGADAETVWIAAQDVTHWRPGDTLQVDVDAIAWPKPLSTAPEGNYQVMALLDADGNAAFSLLTAGDLRSKVESTANLRSTQLRLSERVEEAPLAFPEGHELIDLESRVLSKFWGRRVNMKAVVLLPPDYATSNQRYPTLYYTHGFGAPGPEFAFVSKVVRDEMTAGNFPPMIWVFLDQSSPSGTHEFADSVNNGPWGQALTSELIPHLERRYRMDAKPAGRLLTGHSSGGWATLWLQITYPDLFGGTWSTAPDPVDFRDFTNVNIYTDQNAYRTNGAPVPMIREGGRTTQYVDASARWESVLGEVGGQWSSFEWVFSPRGPDGRPLRLFDRVTGDINADVSEYWRRFDISEVLARRASALAPKLKGKIHVIVGTEDTFHLDEPVRLLQQRIEGLGYAAKFTYLTGRTHFDIHAGGLMTRVTQQMYAVARPKAKWVPKVAPDPATELAK
jgi:enterochelin esterase-like enzyme